jgi:hypothetical protein
MANFTKEEWDRIYRAAREALLMNPKDIEMILSGFGKSESKEPKLIAPEEKWIWVEGYKGTDKNMQGYDNYQFEVGKRYDMPLDVEIQDCRAGFHMSLNVKDVFRHYPINKGNRFFKVRALVREKDYLEYRTRKNDDTYFYNPLATNRNKLVSQSIEFISELTLDGIFENVEEASHWSEKHKKFAVENGVHPAERLFKTEELGKLGYSEAFAALAVKRDRYEVAKAVASQPDLSMDMKAAIIFL